MTGNTAVFGIYKSVAKAEAAVDVLLKSGLKQNDISVLLPDNDSTRQFAHVKGTKAPEGTTTGAVTGGVAGGTIGLLVGLGAISIPGLGPFIAAGPIMATLAGVGAGGAFGGLIGALVGLGIPEYEAKRYEGLVKNGGVLLSVHADSSDEVPLLKKLLVQTGAEDVAATSESTAGVIKGTENRDTDLIRP